MKEIGQTVVRKTHDETVTKHEVTSVQIAFEQKTTHCSCGAITVIKYRNVK